MRISTDHLSPQERMAIGFYYTARQRVGHAEALRRAGEALAIATADPIAARGIMDDLLPALDKARTDRPMMIALRRVAASTLGGGSQAVRRKLGPPRRRRPRH